MSKIIKLGMLFDESTAPDFGDIAFDRERNIVLTSTSLPKLTDNLTRAVCGETFNIAAGTQAFVIDTCDVLAYHPDAWYYVKRIIRGDTQYGSLSVELKSGNSMYTLADNEKIVFSVISNNETVIRKELTIAHFMGNGCYDYKLNLEDAHTLHDLNNHTVDVTVYRGSADITDTLTIVRHYEEEWYDLHVKYDTGV